MDTPLCRYERLSSVGFVTGFALIRPNRFRGLFFDHVGNARLVDLVKRHGYATSGRSGLCLLKTQPLFAARREFMMAPSTRAVANNPKMTIPITG